VVEPFGFGTKPVKGSYDWHLEFESVFGPARKTSGVRSWKKQRAKRMIEPTSADIGRAVVYTGNRYPGGKLEEGVITSFNDYRVFVRYGSDKNSKSTAREDLEWLAANGVRPN
jgi:hypothetical protein